MYINAHKQHKSIPIHHIYMSVFFSIILLMKSLLGVLWAEFGAICHVFSCFSLGSCMCEKAVFIYSVASVTSVGCPVAVSAVFEACRM